MGKSTTHKDLDIWKRGIEFVERIYKITADFPREEIYGLVSQLRRAAISYPSNIAEGAARSSKKEYIQYLYISLASLFVIFLADLYSNRLLTLVISLNVGLVTVMDVHLGSLSVIICHYCTILYKSNELKYYKM